jgi:superfamily II DNA or RNA helicase
MLTLRPHQTKAVNNTYRAIEDGYRRIVLAASCSFGKTVVSSHIANDAVKSGLRVLFVVHMECLIEQTCDKMKSYGLEPGFIKAGYEENAESPVQIASVQTLARRNEWCSQHFDLIISDECHRTAFFDIHKELMNSVYPNAIYIGLTGTTKRLGDEQLGDYYEAIINTPTPLELQKKGFLAPMRYYVPAPKGRPRLESVPIVGFGDNQDYEETALKNACDTQELVSAIVYEWINNKEIGAAGKRTLAFCVNKEHAKNVARAFTENGVPAATIVGEHSPEQRKLLYQWLREKKILVLTSVDVISIGFDEPSVEVGLLLRPTQSEALFLQQVGRIQRISPETGKKEGIILDQAGNCTRHPKPEEIEYYELPTSKPKKERSGQARMKHCPMCDRMNYNFVQDCACGYHYTTERDINENGMIEIEPGVAYSALELKEKFRQYRVESFMLWEPPIEAEKKFANEFGFGPLPEWYKGAIVHSKKIEDTYLDYLADSARLLNKDAEWAMEQYKLEMAA